MKGDLHRMRPYGDRRDDGKIQFSFTLPVPPSAEAKEAAKVYLEKVGFRNIQIVAMEPVGEGFSFFVAYGEALAEIDFTRVRVSRPEFLELPFDELVREAQEKVRRKIVVVGGTTGTDAHTVGIDAILSVKGVSGDRGLEYYPIFRVVNLRAQVDNRHLVEEAVRHQADAILVSKVVTQGDQHLTDLRGLARLLREEKRLPRHLLKIVGGPRMDHVTARKVGFDAGFGPGTRPSEVANFVVHELIRRIGRETAPKKYDRLEGEDKSPAPPKRRSLFGWLGGGG